MGGNIANGSPIGDSPPPLIALGARLVLRRGSERREIALEDFFIDYGKQDRRPGEFVEIIRLPRRDPGRRFPCYKISKRFDQDITACARCLQSEAGARAGRRYPHLLRRHGGDSQTRPGTTLIGQPWNLETIQAGQAALGCWLATPAGMVGNRFVVLAILPGLHTSFHWAALAKAYKQLWKDFVVTISCAVFVADAFGSRLLLTMTQAMSTLLSKHL